MVCFRCGWIRHAEDNYVGADDHPSASKFHSLCPKNLVETQPSSMEVGMEKVTDLGVLEERDVVARPWLGPWVVTTRIHPSRALVPARGKKSIGVC